VAACAGAAIGVVVTLAAGTAIGIITGGLLGPLVGMAVPAGGRHIVGESELTGRPVDLVEATAELEGLGQGRRGGPGAGAVDRPVEPGGSSEAGA
jgi:hypothetical protein